MKKQVQKFAASLLSALLVCGSFSVLPSMAESAIGAGNAIDSIKAVHSFNKKDLENYKAWSAALADNEETDATAAKTRIDNAIARLEVGADVYDDFGNFGTYETGNAAYPVSAGDIMSADTNGSDYEVIWAGLDETSNTGIDRKPYTSDFSYSKVQNKKVKTPIGSKDGILSFSSYDVVKQLYNGEVMEIENRYTTTWVNGVFRNDVPNAKLNILTMNSSFAGKVVNSLKIDTNVSNYGFLIYDYSDIENWSAVSIYTHGGYQNVFVFHRINGKLYKEDKTNVLEFTDGSIGKNSTVKSVLDAANSNNKYVTYGLDYNYNKGLYNFTLSYGDKKYTRELPSSKPLDKLYIGAFPLGITSSAVAYDGYFDNLELSYVSADVLTTKISALPEVEKTIYADTNIIYPVYKEYLALPEADKTAVINKEKLIALADRMVALENESAGKVFTFENKFGNVKDDAEYFANTSDETFKYEIVDNPYINAQNKSNRVLKLVAGNKSYSCGAYNTENVSRLNSPSIFSGKVKFKTGRFTIMPIYIDGKNHTSFIVNIKNDKRTIGMETYSAVNGEKKDGFNYWNVTETMGLPGGVTIDSDSWMDFRTEIKDDGRAYLTLGAYGTDGNYYTNETNWNVKAAASNNYGFAVSVPKNNTAYFDDLSISGAASSDIEYKINIDGKETTNFVKEGESIKLSGIDTPVKDGYKFVGWSSSNGGAVEMFINDSWTPSAGNNTIYAVFVECNGGRGDVNNNGAVDILDLVRAKKVSVHSEKTDDTYRADLDYNGICDATDLAAIRRILLGI